MGDTYEPSADSTDEAFPVANNARNHAPISDSLTPESRGSLRAVLAVLVSMVVVALIVFAIFRTYSDSLSEEFYDLASESMNDYTAAQKVEVESTLREVSSTISTMRVLAESPDIDPTGSTFSSYLETWNEQGSFQVTYTPIESLEAGIGESGSADQDADTLRRLKEGETVISDVRKSTRLNGYFFSIAEPVERDGHTVGVMRSIVRAEELVQTSQVSSQVTLLGSLLINGDGTIVSVSDLTEYIDGDNLYDVLAQSGVGPNEVDAIRLNIENERDVSTVMMGKHEGLMTFVTSIRLDANDWTIVNFTQENSLAHRSESILSSTIFTGGLLVAISAVACLIVALVVSRFRRRARRSAEWYAVLAEFSDTVLFEYTYPRDTLELTPNARTMFSLGSLTDEGYLARGTSFIDFNEEDYPRVHALFEHPAPPNELRTVTCRARVLSGEYRWFSFTCRYLYEGVQPYMAVGKIVDITQQRATEELLTRKSQIDGLTKALNKVTIEEKIGTMLTQNDKALLFVLDMDRFKQINDEYGHLMGDRVLEGVARALFDVFRHRDPVGRIGGDEFVAFVAGVDDEEVANAKREALELLIAETSRVLGVPIALSIGVARYPQDGATYQELFDAADRAMYEAKNEGRA